MLLWQRPSAKMPEQGIRAREIQTQRFMDLRGVYCNSQMTSRLMRKFVRIDEPGRLILKQAMERLGLSARAYDRILKVSLTIADLEGSPVIKPCHLAEAVNYRTLDRDIWGA